MQQFGITTYFGVKNNKTLSENLDYLKSLGFNEISEGLDYVNYPLEDLYNLTKEKGMKIGSFHARYKNQNKTSFFKNNVETTKYMISLKEDIAICSKYHVDNLVVHFDKENKNDKLTPTFFKNIKELIKFAGKKNVIVCVENLNLLLYDDVKELVKKINSPYLKICFDVGHYNAFEDNNNLKKLYEDEFFLKNIKYLHIHGNRGKNDEHLPLHYSNINILLLKEIFAKIPDITLTSETLFTAFTNVSYEEQAEEIMKGLKLLC